MEPWMFIAAFYVVGAFVTMVAIHIGGKVDKGKVDTLDVLAQAIVWPPVIVLAAFVACVALPLVALNWLARRLARRVSP